MFKSYPMRMLIEHCRLEWKSVESVVDRAWTWTLEQWL